MCIYINKKLNSLPEQVEENKENIATNTTAIATNTSDIADIKEEQTTQNGRLTDVEGVASGEVIDRKLLIDDLTLGGDDYTRIKGTNILVKADDTESYMSIKGDDTLSIYQTQADNSGSSIQMSSSGVQIATSDEDGVIQGRVNVKANGDIEISRQYEGTQYTKLLMTNQGIYLTDAQANELAYVNGNLTINDDPLIPHLYEHTFKFTADGQDFYFNVLLNTSVEITTLSTLQTLMGLSPMNEGIVVLGGGTYWASPGGYAGSIGLYVNVMLGKFYALTIYDDDSKTITNSTISSITQYSIRQIF